MNRRVIVLVLVLVVLISTGAYGGFIGGTDKSPTNSPTFESKFVNTQQGRTVEYRFDSMENATVVPNRVESGHDGLVRGNVKRVSGKVGSAVKFNAQQGQIVVENSSSLPTGDGVTFEFWVKPDGGQNSNILGVLGSYWFYVSYNSVNFVVVQNGNPIPRLTSTIPIGEWTHVVGTFDPDAGARLYVNGELADSNGTISEPISSPAENISLNTGGWNEGFNGSIDGFGLWTRALSETEVQMVKQGRERGLVFSPTLRFGITILVLLAITLVTVREHIF